MANNELLISGFADEAAHQKTIEQQCVAFAALGLNYLTLRFVDAGNGIKNVVDLDARELATVSETLNEYDLKVSSIGSPIGKTKLLDIDDGTANHFFEFEHYLESQVTKVCHVAQQLDCKLIRGFSFYQPKNEDPVGYIGEASKRLAAIAAVCDEHGLTFGLEVEANLVGHNAATLMKIHETVHSDALALIFDGANLVTQGYSKREVIQQFQEMKNAIGWIHIKDHRAVKPEIDDRPTPSRYVDEEALNQYVPAGDGESGYPEILREIKRSLPEISNRMKARGADGVFADLEPHLKGGGQFGGFSGPDGFGVATRAFVQLCESEKIRLPLRGPDSISTSTCL